jgi:hypothetical protein
MCQDAMRSLLEQACNSNQDIWVTGMNSIAKWWIHKRDYNFKFKIVSEKSVEVNIECDDRAVVLGRNITGNIKKSKFNTHYDLIKEKHFVIDVQGRIPCIGIPVDSPKLLLDFLDDMGFAYENIQNNKSYSIILDHYETFGPDEEIALIQQIEKTSNPVLRFGLWPYKYKSAFTTTHDLDCVTLTDFFLRIFGG